MRRCGDKYGGERFRDFCLELFGHLSGCKGDPFTRERGEGDEDGIVKRFGPFSGEKGVEEVSAGFVNRSDDGDLIEESVGDVEEVFAEKPSDEGAEQEDESQCDYKCEEAREDEHDTLRKVEIEAVGHRIDNRFHHIDEGIGEEIKEEDDDHKS